MCELSLEGVEDLGQIVARALAEGVEVEAFDLLNQMSSRSYSLNAQMQTESYRNVLRRYVMFNISFRLNKEPKK